MLDAVRKKFGKPIKNKLWKSQVARNKKIGGVSRASRRACNILKEEDEGKDNSKTLDKTKSLHY